MLFKQGKVNDMGEKNNRFSKEFSEALVKLGKYKDNPELVQRIVNSVPFQDLNTELDMIEEEKQKQCVLKVVH